MAREKVKGFDADKFIESVRESAVPTYHTASDSVKPEKKKEECAATSVEKTPIQENPAPIPYPDDDADKYARLNLIESEVDFVKTYVARRNYNQVSKHGKPVFIRERHRKLILDLQSTLGDPPNLSGYIDNVLAEHFKKFYSTIQGIARKCPTKF